MTAGLLEPGLERLSLCARAYDRILKVARTIADLKGETKSARSPWPRPIQYRSSDRASEADAPGAWGLRAQTRVAIGRTFCSIIRAARALGRGQSRRRYRVNPLSHRSVFRLIVLLVGTGWMLVAAPGVRAQAPELPPELQKVRAALEKYQDPYVAVRDGYFSTLGCVEYPKAGGGPGRLPYPAGGMGIHFLNPRLIGPVPDPMRPTILLYAPDGDKLRLVGAEWFIPLATGIKDRPQLFGRPFDGPMEGHEPLLPQDLHHYDLHVWLWVPSPGGLFSPTNPNVKCGKYGYTLSEEAPKVVPHPKP